MALDGRLLARARARLEDRRAGREAMFDEREREAAEKNPRIKLIDGALRSTMMDVIGAALRENSDPIEALEAVREENLQLQKQRERELEDAGFPPDYLDRTPYCPVCGDTGRNGTEPCSCLMELYREEQAAALSSLYKLGDESFDSFSLSWYDDRPNPATGVSPRESMELVYEICLNYARTFGRQKKSLLMSGAPGLGKTFLSACIARVVSEDGYSVVYDTAGAVFSCFERERFSDPSELGTEEYAEIRQERRRYYECDLLIMDDLGTELTNAFIVSSLYDLVNTRIITGKKTVINTNLTPEELSSRYSPALASRLLGEYRLLTFSGTDIRILKNRI